MIWKNLRVSSFFAVLCLLLTDAKQIRVPAVIELELPDEENFVRSRLDPPPPDKVALVARYVVNNADWGVLATHSVRSDIQSFPYASIMSYSDGPLGSGTGIPYIYTTPFDFSSIDLKQDRRATLAVTLAETDYCKNKLLDPMDPRCDRVSITGRIIRLSNDTEEYAFAKKTYNDRHPYIQFAPEDHEFYFAKMDIVSVSIFDKLGGAKIISAKDYLHPQTSRAMTKYYKEWGFYKDRRNHDRHTNYFPLNF